MPTIPPLKLKKKKKNQIKTKTREIPPPTHLHLLSLKSIILAHTTSIRNQDIFLLKKKKKPRYSLSKDYPLLPWVVI